jgi:hypothetical protein
VGRGHGGEEKKSQPLPGLEPMIIPPIAQHYTLVMVRWNENQIKIKIG